MRVASTRYGKRKVYVAGILLLAGVFLYHGMRSLDASAPGKQRQAVAGVAGTSVSCDWEEGGPELYVIRHNTNHPGAGHWFHIAECFTGRRADLKNTIRKMKTSGTVYLQVLDPGWMAGLSPMTRLLIASALTGAGTTNVHFVDADRASFSYSSTSASNEEPPSVHIASNSLPPAREGEDQSEGTEVAPVVPTQGAGGTGGGGRDRRHLEQQPQPRQRITTAAPPNGQPRAGQVGLLEFDPRGRGSEFVVSVESDVSERMIVTADIGTSTENDTVDGEDGEPRKSPYGGGSVRGGGGRETGQTYSGQGDSTRKPICVKYLKTVGHKTVQRKDWFPSPEDARSLRAAIDTFCPVPFLRGDGDGDGDGEEKAGEGESRYRRGGAGEGRGEGEGGTGRVRRLLVYQRDQNRQIRNADKVVEDLRQRLGDGWVVEKMMHDSDRPPCELVATVGRVDVLLTAHGFQSMLGLFMRPGSLLFEVFPHKYFKAGYAPMAEGLGVRHAFSMSRSLRPLMGFSHPSTETCMKWYVCRWYARGSDVEIDNDSLQRVVDLALEPEA
eukprot:g11034.t1